jgi:Acetyltransferase (GNAT) domain
VGGVVTVPEAQKKGLARRLMQHTAEFFEREWKVDAGLLFCLPKLTAYYEALGWQEVESPVLIEQPSDKRPDEVSGFRIALLARAREGISHPLR